MREEIEIKEVKWFVCEVCGYKSSSEHAILACEAQHRKEEKQSTCKHSFYYDWELAYDDLGVEKNCLLCNFKEGEEVIDIVKVNKVIADLYEQSRKERNINEEHE